MQGKGQVRLGGTMAQNSAFDGGREESTFISLSSDTHSTDSLKKTKRKNGSSSSRFLKVAGGFAIFGVVALVVILPVYFEVIGGLPLGRFGTLRLRRRSIFDKTDSQLENAPNANQNDEPSATSSPPTEESQRFDCFPEGDPTREKCLDRGCSWASETPKDGSPWCYYADNDGYELTSSGETTQGYSAMLKRKATDVTPYGKEFTNLRVTVTKMTKDTVRIKIVPEDGGPDRYEVPWQHLDPEDSVAEDEMLYQVEFQPTEGGFFGIQIKRKSSNKILFDTAVGRMIFADQFLQISTKLPSSYIYGFGEHMHESFLHDMNWKSHGMFSRDQGVGINSNLYGVHPYYTCMEGDGNAHGVFFLNSNAQDVSLQPMPALTYRTIGGVFDIYLFLGPEPETVVAQYTHVIGRPYMPPFWALGFQLSRYGYGSLDKLKKVVDRMLATEMPYDVQYSDIDYMDRQLDFTINETTYSGLGDFVRDLKNTHKMKYIIILDPAISGNETERYPPFDLGVDRGVFMTDANGDIAWGKVWPDIPGVYINTSWSWELQTKEFRAFTAFPDFFKNETKQWWNELTVDFYKRIPFDGLWIDMNEPASFVHGTPSNTCPPSKWDNPLPYHPKILGDVLYDKTTCMGNIQYHPVTKTDVVHYHVHSLYGWSQSEPTLDSCRASTGERCMIISRSTFPGSGKYVGHWLGDNTSAWSHLAASIIGMLEFNLFGIPYIGADVCGFFEDTTEELCMRWTQLGAFYPFGRNHNGLGFRDQDPAAFGPEFAAASKKILEVRYYILPYFYTLFYDSHVEGHTVIRSLMAEFPSDLHTYDIDRQLLLGGELLISPVLDEGADMVEAYVPDARWFDFYTGAELAHGLRKTKTHFYAPWDHMPIHIKGGSIIPTQTPARTTDIQRSNGLGVVYAMGDKSEGSGHLFWDDGTSIDTIESETYVKVEFMGTEISVSSKVVHNEYPDASHMIFDHVTVMGIVGNSVVRVLVNGNKHDHFTYDVNTEMLKITHLDLPLTSDWTVVWDTNQYSNRFDCHPETKVTATQTECTRRGCTWDETGIPGVPTCYYPPGYGVYKKDTAPQNTSAGEELYLERWTNRPTLFENPVQRLKVEVESHSKHQLRVKISDASAARYEVPLTVGGVNDERPEEPLYEVIYQDQPFAFKIVRRSTREVIMDTSVGHLIFEDQFLEISSKSSSSFMYGLGEAEHADYLLDFFWTRQAMFANGNIVEQNANLYGHHPYHMTMEKNGHAHGILFLNSNAMEVVLTPLPAVTYRTVGGILDFYVFMGPTPEEVVQQYSAAIGLPMMPPYWALGFQLCKYDYGGIDNLKTVVDEMRAYEIPYDVQYGDIDYMERQLDFTIDSEVYPGLSDFVDMMREQYNMRYVIILDPAISANETDYPAYDEGIDHDVFIRASNGEILFGNVWPGVENTTKLEPGANGYAHVAFPDFFKNETSTWWTKQVRDFYNGQMKFDGLWIDMNEPENFMNGQLNDGGCPASNKYDNPPYLPGVRVATLYENTICMSGQQHTESENKEHGLHYNLHSLYGWSQAAPTLDACQAATGKRCFVIGRSTYPGAGKYEGHWLGDNTSKWPHLRSSIIQMMEFSLFGFSYTGADICGFFENAEEEMCMRWSQLGAFYPFSRNHAMRGTTRQDPAAWGPDFAHAVKDVLEVRYTLLPYLYTLFYHSHKMGSTVVRPVMHEFTSDKQTWGIDRQFLWGPALLISPVLEPGKSAVEAYLPDARWFDYYSQRDMEVRKSTVVLPAPKEHINLHIRGGYILPIQEPNTTTATSRMNDFWLLVALDDMMESTGDLYWDDGESKLDDSKQYIHSTFHVTGNVLENRIIHDGYADSSSMILDRVVVMGLRDDVTQVYMDMESMPDSFSQDPITKTLIISGLNIAMNREFMIRWEVNNEWSRFDCAPDLLQETNITICESRGCIWRSTTTPGVPNCFYSTDSISMGYMISSIDVNESSRKRYTLERLEESPTMYEDDINTIQLDVEYQTNTRLHFKYSDPSNNDRWEIPEEARVLDDSNTASSDENSALYTVTIRDNPHSMMVQRKNTNEVLFDSRDVPLQFADQFLQISTRLPSLNVYGFGEHNHRRYRHDLNWRRWAMFTRDVAPVDDWNLYGMQTFYMAMLNSNDGKCMGLYLHNTNAMDVVLQPTPAVTYRVTGGVLDFYLFVADSPEELVQEYHMLIGHPVMPPYWALGFQLSRWNYGSLDRVKEVVKEMRDAEIPFDVQYGDIDYMDEKKSFTYDPILFKDLPNYVEQLHDWGMRYIIILDPGIKIEEGYQAYDRGIEKDIFIKTPDGNNLVTEVWPGDTYHPDYTNPNSFEWWLTECKEFYEIAGVKYDALWIDMNEPANFQPDDPAKLEKMNCTGKYNIPPYMPRILGYSVGLHDKSFCMDNLQHFGLHYDVHSLYGHSMSYVTFDTLKEIFPEKRSLALTRSTFAGSGKYAQHWLGDNQSLWPQMAWSIPAMFEFNLFGFPFIGADVCGFYFNTTAEMCQRWMQVGAFYPFSRNHNAADMIPQHPTVFGQAVIDSSKKALNIRYSILPYMYTQFQKVNAMGGTLVRALVHEFPHDSQTWNVHRQFLLGPAFLITPVLDQGVTEVTAYFPSDSRWYNFHTGVEEMSRGKFVSLDAPMDHINLHVRGGYILPMQEPNVTTTLSRTQNMSLLVALDDNQAAVGDLYWDDGEARNVSENYFMHQFACSKNELTIFAEHQASMMPEADNLHFTKVTIHGLEREPVNVQLDETEIEFDYDMNILTLHNLDIHFASANATITWQ